MTGVMIGSKWLERDNRFQRFVEVVGYVQTGPHGRYRIKTLSTDGVAYTGKRTTMVCKSRFFKAFMVSPHE